MRFRKFLNCFQDNLFVAILALRNCSPSPVTLAKNDQTALTNTTAYKTKQHF